MTIEATIPTIAGGGLTVNLGSAAPTFVVGPNGAGKSGLLHHIFIQNAGIAVKISAHRANTLSTNAIQFSPADKINNERTAHGQDTQSHGRYLEWSSESRSGFVLADLVDADNALARQVRDKLQTGDVEGAQASAENLPPLSQISLLMQESGIPISISIAENSSIVARKRGGNAFSVSAMSDGERAALLIGGRVLTAKPGSLILLDEPERHLHASISVPLLANLFNMRSDCTFVISTHDLGLPEAFTSSSVIIARDSVVDGDQISQWDVDIVSSILDIDDEIRSSIMGSRRKIVFIEGGMGSLDLPLYNLILPGVSVEPRETAFAVQKTVDGVRSSSKLHWVQAFGILDRDQISVERQAELVEKGIYALDVYSVEGLYYHPQIQALVADRQAGIIGGEAAELLADAENALLSSFQQHIERMCARMSEQKVKDALSRQLPDWQTISRAGPITVSVDAAEYLSAERAWADDAIARRDVGSILARYPVRETPALGGIAQALRFSGRATYEAAVRKLTMDDSTARAILRGCLGALPAALGIAD